MKRDNVHDFQQMDIKMATNKPKRKTYSDEFKEFLVQEAEVSGRSIASIARDNGINQNLLHNWKREHKGKQSQTDRLPARIDNNASSNNSTFIPVSVQPKPNREQITDFPHCQNSCHPHPNNINGEKGDNHGTIQCRTQTSYTEQTFIT